MICSRTQHSEARTSNPPEGLSNVVAHLVEYVLEEGLLVGESLEALCCVLE